MTALAALVVVLTLAVVVVFAGNRAIDRTTSRVKATPVVRPRVTGCPRCGGPLTISRPGPGDPPHLVGRSYCAGCGQRLTVAAT